MTRFATILILVSFLFQINITEAQSAVNPSSYRKAWNAQWIAANDAGTDYGVYYFRKKINLVQKPTSFLIHLSADNRYKLYVNDSLVSVGPLRGDLSFWNYGTINIASYLNAGENVVAAIVWNEAQYRPAAQISIRTAFILQGNSSYEEILNTNNSWKCIRDIGRSPIPGYFFAASKGEMINMNETVKENWKDVLFNDSSWSYAIKVADGKLKGMSWGGDWNLVPASLPPRELTYQRISVLRSAKGINILSEFPAKKSPVIIPANTTVSLLLDQTFETNAYITLSFSRGKNATLSIGYAEALYKKESKGTRKGNRNDVDDKEFVGRIDSLISNGLDNQSFTSLNFRTYRYIQLNVKTHEEPLILNDIYGTFTAYPFQRTSVFKSPDSEINKILDIGWRTARLNAYETYTDCPYYEQLQYIGDTRIQALVSYYNTSDDRLARNALDEMDHSRLAEGVTRSCYPSNGTQIISTFSLWYICMLHDYWMYRNDNNFIKNKLTGERAILDFFKQYEQPDGSLKNMPYWAFVDWSGNLAGDVKGGDGCAAIYDLQLLWAYQCAEEMEVAIGLKDYAATLREKIVQLKQTINRKYWDPVKKLYADTKDKNGYSQHANSLAILTGVANKTDVKAICNTMLTDKSLTQCSIYFKYYLHQALVKGGLGNDYMNWLGIWRDNIKMGLTTWAEYSDLEYSRSDCHAWGSSPNIEFFRVVLGIDSDEPGFGKIIVQPHLGNLTNVSGEIPHPLGKISVEYKLNNDNWNMHISLPHHTSGKFIWKTNEYKLKEGINTFIIKNN